jgi:siroheme synthase (precorrin-2 oxidase/ferrochelatase)
MIVLEYTMNQISAESPLEYYQTREQIKEELAEILKQLEKDIREEIEGDYKQKMASASWWKRYTLQREIEQTIQSQTDDASEALLAEHHVPKASNESLW